MLLKESKIIATTCSFIIPYWKARFINSVFRQYFIFENLLQSKEGILRLLYLNYRNTASNNPVSLQKNTFSGKYPEAYVKLTMTKGLGYMVEI